MCKQHNFSSPQKQSKPNIQLHGVSDKSLQLHSKSEYDRVPLDVLFGSWSFMNFGFYQPASRALFGNKLLLLSAQLYHEVASGSSYNSNFSGLTVLEVGMGRGGGLEHILRYFKPARLIGVDLALENVQFVQKKLRHRIDRGTVRIFHDDSQELANIDDSSVDVVLNVESSHTYPSLESFFAQVYRVLKVGGVFLYTDFFSRYLAGVRVQTLQRLGFAVFNVTDITDPVLKALEIRDDMLEGCYPELKRHNIPLWNFLGGKGSWVRANLDTKAFLYAIFVAWKFGPVAS